jgi:hypothetical protein
MVEGFLRSTEALAGWLRSPTLTCGKTKALHPLTVDPPARRTSGTRVLTHDALSHGTHRVGINLALWLVRVVDT